MRVNAAPCRATTNMVRLVGQFADNLGSESSIVPTSRVTSVARPCILPIDHYGRHAAVDPGNGNRLIYFEDVTP